MIWQWAQMLVQGIGTSLQLMYCSHRLTTLTNQDKIDSDFQWEFARQQFQLRQQEQQQQFQTHLEMFRLQGVANLPEIEQQFQTELEVERQKFEVKLLKAQFLQQYSSINPTVKFNSFEQCLELANLNEENIQIIIAFRQHWDNLRINESQEFEKLLPEARKKHECSLKRYDREMQMLLAERHVQDLLGSAEYQKILENHPFITQSTPTLDFYKQYRDGSKPIPPLILICPPLLEVEQFPYAANGFAKIAAKLTEQLRDFLSANYDIYHQERPTKLLDGAYKNQRSHSDAALEILHWTHKSIPTLIFESKVDGDTIKLYLGWWDIMEPIPHYKKLMSIPWKEVLYPLVREKAQRWQEYRAMLLSKGKTLEEVQSRGGDNEINLAILLAEEEDKQLGWEQTYNYHVNGDEYIQEVADVLGFCHCLLAAFAVDQYYLFHYNVCPKLPELLPGLLEQVPNEALKQQLIPVVVSSYRHLYEALKHQQPDWIPELALDLALSLIDWDDKSWARGQMNYAIASWLQLRGVTVQYDVGEQVVDTLQSSREMTNTLLSAMESLIFPTDSQLVAKLNQCLVILSDNRSLSVLDACYRRGISCYQTGDYQEAIEYFNQVIQSNPEWLEVYYNRGLTYEKLEEYQSAIADYTHVIWLKPYDAEAYTKRGNAYNQLGKSEKAIADYNQALKINPHLAEVLKNKSMAQSMLAEQKRQDDRESNRYHAFAKLKEINDNIPKKGLPVTLITGFVGSGKTTLVNHMIASHPELKFFVLVNELGETAVDDRAGICKDKLDIWTYRNIKHDSHNNFIDFIYRILEREYLVDHLIIETSGLADPLPLELTFLDTELKEMTHLNSVITMIDSEKFGLERLKSQAARNQFDYGDVIILNKTDKASEGTVNELESDIRTLKKGARVVRCKYGKVPLPLISDWGLEQIEVNSHNLEDENISLVSFQNDRPFAIKKFEHFLENQLPSSVFRAKGILWFEESPKCHGFHLSGKRCSIYDEDWRTKQKSQLVLIGENLDAEWLNYLLENCLS